MFALTFFHLQHIFSTHWLQQRCCLKLYSRNLSTPPELEHAELAHSCCVYMHRSRENTCALQLMSVCPCVGNNELFVSNLASLLVKIEKSWHAMYSYIADSRWTHNIHDTNIRRENEDDEKTWSSGCARRQIMRGDAFDVWLTVEASDHHSAAPDMRNQLYLRREFIQDLRRITFGHI